MYRVIAGWNGTVYQGDNGALALLTFESNVADSKNNVGKMGGESVDMWLGETLEFTFVGKNDLN